MIRRVYRGIAWKRRDLWGKHVDIVSLRSGLHSYPRRSIDIKNCLKNEFDGRLSADRVFPRATARSRQSNVEWYQ